MKLLPFSYELHPGPETQIGHCGYMMFIRATSQLGKAVAFAVYYDDNLRVWHVSALAYGELELLDASLLCDEIYAARKEEIILLLAEARLKNETKNPGILR